MEGKGPVIPRQANHPDDAPPITQEIPSEGVKALSATLQQIADDLKSATIANNEATERAERVLADIRKESEKNVPRTPSEPNRAGAMTPDRLMRMRSHDKDVIDWQDTANRALCRATIRAAREGRLQTMVWQDDRGIARQIANLASIPVEVWRNVPEYQDLTTLAAGTFIDTTTSGGGSQWVPTGFARTAVDFYFTDSAMETTFTQQIIPEGVGSFSVPIETTRAQAEIEDQQTGVQSAYINTGILNVPQTGVISFTPKKLAIGYQWSSEANEDLAVDMMQRALNGCPKSIRRGVRQCLINGQPNDSALLDDDEGTSLLVTANAWAGTDGDESLRLHCIVNSFTTSVGGAITYDTTLSMRQEMGTYGVNPDELAFTCSPKAYIGLLRDKDAVTTVDKMGPLATVLRGQLASCGGVPVLPEGEFPDTMDAGGINAGTSTFGGGIMYNRLRWWLAAKRQIETVVIPGTGYDIMTVISRWRGMSKIAVTNEHNAHFAINVS